MKHILFSFLLLSFARIGWALTDPNPASRNCTQLGGAIEGFNSPEGQRANCVIEEGTLFNAMSARNLLKGDTASANCGQIGGSLRAAQGNYCVIDIWTLFSAIDVLR